MRFPFLIFYQPFDGMLELIGLFLEFQLVQSRDTLFYMVIIQSQQIGDGDVPVFIPGKQKPVHDVRMPVTLRNLGAAKRQHMPDGLHGKLGQAGAAMLFLK